MRISNLKTVLTLLCTVFFSLSSVGLSAIPSRPSPPRLVNDMAGVFSHSQAMELERKLVAYHDTTSTQIVVLTVRSLEGMSSAEYAVEVGEKWGVGSSKYDNGVVVLVKPKTRRESGDVFIATGYGLEGAIPDAYAKRIIDEIMIPRFQANDYFGAVDAACDKIMSLASGEEFGPPEKNGLSIWNIIIVIAILMLFISLFSKNNKNGSDTNGGGSTGGRGPIFIPPYMGGFGGPRSRGNGGGFGGGFGGFGGGSFGGGGAGGKW